MGRQHYRAVLTHLDRCDAYLAGQFTSDDPENTGSRTMLESYALDPRGSGDHRQAAADDRYFALRR
ncbi:hypothetical protein HDF16_001850 [Granulicella aggregans]|uniref:Uncharacterized protein n=1 Tax=Granulicella aggregans TaxID=474949 RepID=A0A7W7ZC45_9BACT|nr:hypothetical protein [Granulicella aggregans]MBB5057165.1 hypothetical protein [Granulicella aggregans]